MSTRSTADFTLGNPVVAIGWSEGEPGANAPGESKTGCLEHPYLDNYSGLSHGRSGQREVQTNLRPSKIVTWLILPVVICLSQRLSHACLSISTLYCETANGSLNQLSFI